MSLTQLPTDTLPPSMAHMQRQAIDLAAVANRVTPLERGLQAVQTALALPSAWTTIEEATQGIGFSVGNNSFMMSNGIASLAASGALVWGTGIAIRPFYFDPADYAVTGKTLQMRTRTTTTGDGNNPGAGSFYSGMWPVTGLSDGGAGNVIACTRNPFTEAAAASSPTFSTATQIWTPVGSGVVAGTFMLCCIVAMNSGSTAANAATIITSTLQYRHV